MTGYYTALCILTDGTILPYHAAFTMDSKVEISKFFKFVGTGYIFATGNNCTPYVSDVKYRFYVTSVPKEVKIKRRLYRDLINELRKER